MITTPPFLADSPWLDQLLDRLPEARVAVFGDLCLDAYWQVDPAREELSIETGLPTRPVGAQRYSPGGAGNVAANLKALGVRDVVLVGQVGTDLFGAELMRQLTHRQIGTGDVVESAGVGGTLVYAKPYRSGTELNRLDFGGENALAGEAWAAVLTKLEAAVEAATVVVINQQIKDAWSDEVVEGLNALFARHPDTRFIVDSRDFADRLRGAALKLNEAEAVSLLDKLETGAMNVDRQDSLAVAAALAEARGQPVFLTRGERGIALAVEGRVYDIPGIELLGGCDPVGAGDTALAVLAAALAVGAGPLEAGTLANMAAAITAHKRQTTGTATPEELRVLGPAPDYIYLPRLAAQPRLARWQDGTRIELASGRAPGRPPRHAIFDHDGTLSVLREGWESVMEPMMVKAVLGPAYATVDDATHERVGRDVRELIDRTTGIQTLAQMKALIGMVREMGFVPADEVLDEHGYKAIYNDALLDLVRSRREQLAGGELCSEDWQIKNARPLLDRFRAAGVTLYLASGTDVQDVRDEATAMGYADLFGGGIFGAVGDLKAEAKRDVFLRILATPGVDPSELVIIGDGPVEMREGRRRGAFTVGVASDEVRRHGGSARKRTRLIRAGADVIVPDFSQMDALLRLLLIQ